MERQTSGVTLHLDEKLSSSLIDSIRGILWECDPLTFRFSYVSPHAEKILGYPCRQWIDEPHFRCTHIHPDDVDRCAAYYLQAAERGEEQKFEYRMLAANGRTLWFRDIVTVCTGSDGSKKLRGILIDITDAKEAEIRLRAGEEEITERKQAEQTLREQKELYRAMFSQAPDGVVLVDAETLKFEEFNDMACEGLGYTREEFARLTVSDINAEFQREWQPPFVQEIINLGQMGLETVHRHRDGSLRNVRVGIRPVSINNRRYLLAFWTDITGKIHLLEDLKLREHYQRALLDNFPYAAWMKNREGRFLAANRQLARFLDLFSPKDVVGRTAFDVLPPEVAERTTEEDRSVLSTGRTKQTEEELPVNGVNRWFEVYRSPITIGGEIIGTVGCNWDITERKFMERALKESEERYRRLVELSPDAVFIHTEGKFVFMNLAASQLLGAERPEDLYGKAALNFVHPDCRETVRQRIENAWARRDNPNTEELLVRLDGSTVPVEMISVHFQYQGVDSVLAIARDITERKRMQDEIVKRQKLESLGVLAGGIAHDFNNILTGILGNISLVRNQLGSSNPVAARLESCENAAIRAGELTQQLLTFARGGEPVKKTLAPAPLISESATFVLRGSNVRCEIKTADDLRDIDADPGQISQVLHNLLINSKQAMPSGGVIKITAENEEVKPDADANLPPGKYVKIAMDDEGCGIAPENLPKIFDPYFTTKSEGSGLGLASVYSILRRHGGAVGVTSEVGAGSCFTLYLPVASTAVHHEEMAGAEETLSGTGRILVMDDEEIIREVASEILAFAGYQVETCPDGKEAVEMYRASYESGTPFDVTIMDLTVPGGMGGKEAASMIREIDQGALLMVASGYSNDPVIAGYRQYGFSASVVKPFSAGALVAEVRRLIGADRLKG